MNVEFHCSESANFRDPGQSVRAFSYTEYSIDPHNHDFYEMNIVLGGRGIHRIEDAEFTVGRGDVFVIPPMVVHSYSSTEHLEVYHVLLRKDFIRGDSEAKTIPGFLQLMEIEPFLRQSNPFAAFLHLDSRRLEEIKSDFKFIEEYSAFAKEGYEPLCIHTARKMIYYLSYLLHRQMAGGDSVSGEKYRRQVLDTLEYLHLHFGEKITLQTLSERCYLSRSTLLRSFSEVCGVSPSRYLADYRIKKACELMESAAMSKTDIAHTCGFYDLSHMERCMVARNITAAL